VFQVLVMRLPRKHDTDQAMHRQGEQDPDMDIDYERRNKQALFQMQYDMDRDMIRPKYWARILQGTATPGKD
jgi:hypothetical protein